jgi:hypothetical protein
MKSIAQEKKIVEISHVVEIITLPRTVVLAGYPPSPPARLVTVAMSDHSSPVTITAGAPGFAAALALLLILLLLLLPLRLLPLLPLGKTQNTLATTSAIAGSRRSGRERRCARKCGMCSEC